MEDKPNIEILSEFAKATNRKIFAHEEAYPHTGFRTFQRFKRTVYIPINEDQTSFFLWYSNPYPKIGETPIYCGAFISLEMPKKSGISIRQKNIVDKLNVFARNRGYNVGNSKFDSKVIIEGKPNIDEQRLLSKHKLQNKILEALNSKEFLNISINEYNLDFVPELKDSSYMAIVNPQNWDVEYDFIEDLFVKIENIRQILKMNY